MGRKVAIVGFRANTWDVVPWGDESFEVWGLNSLWLHPGAPGPWARWYELHQLDMVVQELPADAAEKHMDWLKAAGHRFPIYMHDRFAQFPDSARYPLEDVKRLFGRYACTNSISMMMAHALLESVDEVDGRLKLKPGSLDELHVYGVDMASDSEYGHQKPSCEYVLGIARGLGVKTFVPAKSDLLKNPVIYGYESMWDIKAKIDSIIDEQTRDMNAAEHQMRLKECEVNQRIGYIECAKHIRSNWITT